MQGADGVDHAGAGPSTGSSPSPLAPNGPPSYDSEDDDVHLGRVERWWDHVVGERGVAITPSRMTTCSRIARPSPCADPAFDLGPWQAGMRLFPIPGPR